MRIKTGALKNYWWSTSISNTEFIVGSYENEAFDQLKEVIAKDDIILDIGANFGYFSLFFSIKSPEGNVHAFEPIPASKKLLDKHLAKNNITNVSTFEAGISNEIGSIEFTHSENLAANTYKSESPIYSNSKKIKVKVTTIDEFVKLKNLEKLDFIKIDVEGAELDVLKGAEKTLKLLKPKLLLATHDCHIDGIKQKCLDFLTQLNYSFQSSGESKETEGQEDFLCFPKHKTSSINN